MYRHYSSLTMEGLEGYHNLEKTYRYGIRVFPLPQIFPTFKSRKHTYNLATVGASSSVTRRVLAEIIYVIYYEVWAVFILDYKLKG